MIRCSKCGYERTEANSSTACPRCSAAYAELPIAATPEEQVICPKCGYVRTEADPRTACRTCGVVYAKQPYAKVICPKCSYERTEADSLAACPKCGVSYINTASDTNPPISTPPTKSRDHLFGKNARLDHSLIRKNVTSGTNIEKKYKIFFSSITVAFLLLMGTLRFYDSPSSKGDYLSSMNGRWTYGSEIILVNAANGKLYAMTDKGLAIIFEPTSGAVQSVDGMDARTTTFLPIASNPLGKITDVMGLSLAEFSALAIRDSNEFSRLKVKMDNAAIEIKKGEKKDGSIFSGYGLKQLVAGKNVDDVNKRITFDHTFHLTFDRKLTNEEIGVMNEFAKDPAKGLKQNVAIDKAVAEFLSNTQKRAELFKQQKVALENIAPDVRSIVSKVLPQQLERDEAWDVLGLKAPPSISGVTKLSFKKNLALEFTLPSEAFGSSCILHTEPKSLGQSPISDWGVWLTGANCQDNKVTEAAITDIFETKQIVEPKFTVEKL